MTLLEKGDSFFGRKNNNKPLMRSNVDYKALQCYIYLTDMDNSNCIPTLVNLALAVCYTKCARAQSISQCVDAGQLNVPL